MSDGRRREAAGGRVRTGGNEVVAGFKAQAKMAADALFAALRQAATPDEKRQAVQAIKAQGAGFLADADPADAALYRQVAAEVGA